jgi:integrase
MQIMLRKIWISQRVRVPVFLANHRVTDSGLRGGPKRGKSSFVFTSGVGTLINPSNLRRRSFAPLLQKAGIPQIRFHDLRHTCATLLFSKGAHPKHVQELLGPATVAITLDTIRT